MEEFLNWIKSNVYEVCMTAGLIFSTIFNRNKPTKETLEYKKAKKLKKLEKKGVKQVEKARATQDEIDLLKKEK